MALFSFSHSVKTFSEKREQSMREAQVGQTAAHLRYITRPQATRVIVRERVASKNNIEVAQLAEEQAQRSKGRVCERFRIALPVEATPEQREALVRAFGDALTEGLAGYIAGIHDQSGNDLNNPHFHMAAFDHHQRSGGRGRPRSTLGMARKNAVERTAKLWADTHNRLMKEWGFGPESLIDHRSYKERGIDRIPQIHEGPASRAMAEKGDRPETKKEWREVDDGHTRAEANEIIREINKLKETKNEGHDTDGLGSGDDRNSTKDKADRENDGTLPWGTDRSDRNSEQTVAGDPRDQRFDQVLRDGTGGPPFLTDNASQGNLSTKTRNRNPPFLDWQRFGRRHGVRRIYRELVMLRDTLRARLRRNGNELHRQHRRRSARLTVVGKSKVETLKAKPFDRQR
jgi:hypothetical protein